MSDPIIAQKKIFLGKLNRSCTRTPGHGPRNCKAFVEWELRQTAKGPEFSATAEVWNHIGTDIIMGGQCLDDIVPQFPGHKRAQRILAIWREWHLNGMNAGTPAQDTEIARRQAIEAPKHQECYYYGKTTVNAHHLATVMGFPSWYDLECQWLKDAGLYEVPHPDKPGETYRYGHAWLYRALPAEIIAELTAMAAAPSA